MLVSLAKSQLENVVPLNHSHNHNLNLNQHNKRLEILSLELTFMDNKLLEHANKFQDLPVLLSKMVQELSISPLLKPVPSLLPLTTPAVSTKLEDLFYSFDYEINV